MVMITKLGAEEITSTDSAEGNSNEDEHADRDDEATKLGTAMTRLRTIVTISLVVALVVSMSTRIVTSRCGRAHSVGFYIGISTFATDARVPQ